MVEVNNVLLNLPFRNEVTAGRRKKHEESFSEMCKKSLTKFSFEDSFKNELISSCNNFLAGATATLRSLCKLYESNSASIIVCGVQTEANKVLYYWVKPIIENDKIEDLCVFLIQLTDDFQKTAEWLDNYTYMNFLFIPIILKK